MTKLRMLTLILMVFAAAATRVIPHPPSFTAVGACALFAGARFPGVGTALAVPLSAMLLSDLALGYGVRPIMVVTYGTFALTVALGRLICRRRSPVRVGLAATLSAGLFFVVVNFGVWLLPSHPYPLTTAGLAASYLAALPYFTNMLMANLFYCGILFGGLAFAERFVEGLREEKKPVVV